MLLAVGEGVAGARGGRAERGSALAVDLDQAARHSAKNLQFIVGVVNLRPEQYWGRMGVLESGMSIGA